MLTVWIEKWQLPRGRAAMMLGLIVWLLSLGTVFSFVPEAWTLAGHSFFELLDYLTSNIMLPMTSLGTALFVGWAMQRETARRALRARSDRKSTHLNSSH